MRALTVAGMLAVATNLVAGHADAAPLTPTLQFEGGGAASIPVTGGSLSFGGITITGAPLVGSATQQVMQVDGAGSFGGLFGALPYTATEYNLTSPSPLVRRRGWRPRSARCRPAIGAGRYPRTDELDFLECLS